MINPSFKRFIEDELLPHTELKKNEFWEGLEQLIEEFSPRNAALLEHRMTLKKHIDRWHSEQSQCEIDAAAYKAFLKDIGYLVDSGPDFRIETENVDNEIATIAGPQLVVPLKNARFALNAANARWGSLYDALYGSDIIDSEGEDPKKTGYDPYRGDKVIAYAKGFLDQRFPLSSGSHKNAILYYIQDYQLHVTLEDHSTTILNDSSKFLGFTGPKTNPTSILLINNALHVEIKINALSDVGQSDKARVSDINLEAAVTTIMDCEDSVAAVDCEDKIEVYRNWLGLMAANLTASFDKGKSTHTRQLNSDKNFTCAQGKESSVSARSLLFNRNVGLLMKTDLMTDAHGDQVPEHIMDAVVTALGSMADTPEKNGYHNSKTGSIYIVKPKMHGPEEVAFVCDLFSAVEKLLRIPKDTIKLGIMDEERRTTVNLKECIRQAKNRLVFINTGFLDRTGDEISTSMEAGAFLPKEKIKLQPWIQAYENQNVDVGLACGLSGKAQIGKGMWAMPDEMNKMMSAKIQHPEAGANTAWVPSPTAAVLHALHYHQVDVFKIHEELTSQQRDSLDQILQIPLMSKLTKLSNDDIQNELDNNIQGILGYVVRWVEMGIGCSKVPDIHNTELMEDRATLRISAIHIANWLRHGICSAEAVNNTLERMAAVVDAQNAHDSHYHPMSTNLSESLGFQAARALIFDNESLPNGYTEPALHQFRLRAKAV